MGLGEREREGIRERWEGKSFKQQR